MYFIQYDRNARSQQILTKSRAVETKYDCERITKCRSEMLFVSRVINLTVCDLHIGIKRVLID